MRTQLDVAAHYKVSEDCVRKWRKHGMPGKQGEWDLDEIEAWRRRHARQTRPQNGNPDQSPPGKGSEDRSTRKAEAETMLSELKAAKAALLMRREFERLCELDDVEAFLSEWLTWTREQLMKIPVDIMDGYPDDIRPILQEDLNARLDLVLRGAYAKLQDMDRLELQPVALK